MDWHPWDTEALAKAKAENKPIFLSIGYAACHWCHVMAHESFEDPETAALMNQHYINIKVDREERPDLDSIYMSAMVAMTGSGGWPMSVFLTPDLASVLCRHLFPARLSLQLPSFRDLLKALANAWQNEPEKAVELGATHQAHIQSQTSLSRYELALKPEHLETAVKFLLEGYDWGMAAGESAQIPATDDDGVPVAPVCCRRYPGSKPAVHALHAMARGGMYDVVGGGFSRYSVDNFWRVPHFEKMLYDNAQLVRAYLHAWQITGEPDFKRIVAETLGFVPAR